MPPPAEGLASRLFLGPALRTQPDRRLVTLVRDGYEAAFEEIVRRYGRPLGRYAASIVGGRSEDVLQEAFAKALPALLRDDAEIDLRPWLFRIVRNTALNDLRDSPPSAELLAEVLAGGRNPVDELEQREELADLIGRLRALPEPQRAAIVMRELEGLGHEEIAAALGLTGGGARQAIYRARQALRDGTGMLLPLPLLKAFLGGALPGATEVAAGSGGIGGAAGAGVALKATAAAVLVAGAVGAGVALEHDAPTGEAKAAPVRSSQRGSNAASTPTPAAPEPSADAGTGSGGDGAGRREAAAGGSPGQSGQGGGGPFAPAPTRIGRSPAGAEPAPSHSGSSGHGGEGSGRDPGHSDLSGGDSASSGDPGTGGDSVPGQDGGGEDGSATLEGAEDPTGGDVSGGDVEESAASGDATSGPDGSSGSDGDLRDLQETGVLTE